MPIFGVAEVGGATRAVELREHRIIQSRWHRPLASRQSARPWTDPVVHAFGASSCEGCSRRPGQKNRRSGALLATQGYSSVSLMRMRSLVRFQPASPL